MHIKLILLKTMCFLDQVIQRLTSVGLTVKEMCRIAACLQVLDVISCLGVNTAS